MTITHPCHPLHGKQVPVLYTCRGPEARLIVRLPDGLRAYIPVDWTDLAPSSERGPPTDLSHLLDLDGLRQVVQLVEHIRHDGRGDACPPEGANADEKGAYNETHEPSAL